LNNQTRIMSLLIVLILAFAVGNAIAGAKLEINENAHINLGYRLQAYFQNTDDGDDSTREFRLRRARFRLKGVVNEKVSVFLQTDVSGKDVQMIDAFVTYKPGSPWFQFVMGRNMAPTSRQATTSSGALMALDRPYHVNNALTWNAGGARGDGIDSSPDRVRDNGLTLFGSNAVGNGGFKYYAGIYNGVQYETSGDPGDVVSDDKDRFTFRAQYNFWNPEGGYYNSSTYLGKKKTLGIGFSYDTQAGVGASDNTAGRELVDYSLMSADAFIELPFENGGALTAEAGYNSLDFGDAVDFKMYKGSGFYGQIGWLLKMGLQPWFLYEAFTSDMDTAPNGGTDGDWTNMRFGVTYFIDGQHANIKLAWESYKVEIGGAAGDEKDSTTDQLTLGFFTTY